MEAIGELGRGQIAQQLVFGDVPDDPDVRGAGAQRVVANHGLQRVSIPRLADNRRERVPLTREDLQDLSELLLEHQPPFVRRRSRIGVINGVADLGDQALPGNEAAGQAATHEARSASASARRTWPQDEPLRPFPEGPTSTQNSFG